MTLHMDIVENFKEKRKMLLGVRNELKELKEKVSVKENSLEASCEKIINELFRQLIVLKEDVIEKTTKMQKNEEDAIAKHTELQQMLNDLKHVIEDRNKIIDELKNENMKLTERLNQKAEFRVMLEEPIDISDDESTFPQESQLNETAAETIDITLGDESTHSEESQLNETAAETIDITLGDESTHSEPFEVIVVNGGQYIEPEFYSSPDPLVSGLESVELHNVRSCHNLSAKSSVTGLGAESNYRTTLQKMSPSHCSTTNMEKHASPIQLNIEKLADLDKTVCGSDQEKPHSCNVCGKCFSSYKLLNNHYLRHTNQKRHSCGTCSKSYFYRSELQRHMVVHSKVKKPFVCNICQKSFTTLHSLRNHKRKHAGKGPHVCSVCSKSFVRVYNLKKHKCGQNN